MIAFVHGVPETAAIWGPLRERLGEESVALRLPGFGTPRPDGFEGTKDDYLAAIVAEIETLDGPVDLVGQDWGGLLTLRVATTRPELLRSWIADCAYCFHPDFAWHPWAKEWQTPGLGEGQISEGRGILVGPNELLRTRVGQQTAREVIAAQDDTMQRCILDLYRSAAPNLFADWGKQITQSTTAPGVVLVTALDSEGSGPGQRLDREVAQMLGAGIELFESRGHWWMLEDPDGSVDMLRRCWDSIKERDF